jgi:uncharacterized protein DUF1638
MFLKVIACEIAVRELQYAAARCKNLIDLEFLTQGHHDTPTSGREELQKRIDAVPAGKYDAIVLGYALCSKILAGLKPSHIPLVIPRAHDCITLFLGSKERYQKLHSERPGTYYYTSGWLECAARRGNTGSTWGGAPSPANSSVNLQATYQRWVHKYGEDQAKYLIEEISRWTETYSHGCLIDFDFLKQLDLAREVRQICADQGWTYDRIPGDLSLFQRMLDGPWTECDFLIVQPGQKVVASFDEKIIAAEA